MQNRALACEPVRFDFLSNDSGYCSKFHRCGKNYQWFREGVGSFMFSEKLIYYNLNLKIRQQIVVGYEKYGKNKEFCITGKEWKRDWSIYW
jgi:hypothetical protein